MSKLTTSFPRDSSGRQHTYLQLHLVTAAAQAIVGPRLGHLHFASQKLYRVVSDIYMQLTARKDSYYNQTSSSSGFRGRQSNGVRSLYSKLVSLLSPKGTFFVELYWMTMYFLSFRIAPLTTPQWIIRYHSKGLGLLAVPVATDFHVEVAIKGVTT